MKSCKLRLFFCLILTFALIHSAAAMERCLLFPWLRSSTPVAKTYEAPRAAAPTSYVVERPIIVSRPVSTSMPVRVSPPVYETLRAFESPVPLSVSDGFVTRVEELPIVSYPLSSVPVSVVERRAVEAQTDSETYYRTSYRTVSPEEEKIEYAPFSASRELRSAFEDRESLLPLRSIEEASKPVENASTNESRKTFSNEKPTIAFPEKAPEVAGDNRLRELLMRPPVPPENERAVETPVSVPPKPSPPPTILGQSSFSNDIKDALATPPSFPEGSVDPTMIPKRLLDDPVSANTEETDPTSSPADDTTGKAAAGTSGPSTRDQWTLGSLLVATIVSTMTLIYVLIIALDYRQRWMQSLMTQNGRFSGLSGEEDGMYDYSDPADSYGGGSSYFGAARDSGVYRPLGREYFGAGY